MAEWSTRLVAIRIPSGILPLSVCLSCDFLSFFSFFSGFFPNGGGWGRRLGWMDGWMDGWLVGVCMAGEDAYSVSDVVDSCSQLGVYIGSVQPTARGFSWSTRRTVNHYISPILR